MVEYYFDNGKLIFAFDQAFKYNRPIYWDKKKLKNLTIKKFLTPKKQL